MAMTTRSMTRKARKVTCTKFETTDKKTPKSLLDLPPELREHVYRYLFKGSRITFKECTYSTYTRTNVELALTLTNKTIRLESLPCLYQSTQLLFDRTEVSYRINELIPKGFLASVKHVSCYVSQLCGMQINAKVFPSLVKLDVYIGDLHHDYQEDYEKAIETEMNRIYVDKAFEILAMPVYEGLAEGMGIANEARSYEITMTIKINLLRFFDGSRKGYGAVSNTSKKPSCGLPSLTLPGRL